MKTREIRRLRLKEFTHSTGGRISFSYAIVDEVGDIVENLSSAAGGITSERLMGPGIVGSLKFFKRYLKRTYGIKIGME